MDAINKNIKEEYFWQLNENEKQLSVNFDCKKLKAQLQ